MVSAAVPSEAGGGLCLDNNTRIEDESGDDYRDFALKVEYDIV